MKKILLYFSLIIIAIIALQACGGNSNKSDDKYVDSEYKDLLKKIEINPEYARNPPIAEDVLVKKIKGDNEHLLVAAKFSQTVLKGNYLAMKLGGEKIVLRDDGKGADEKAGDRLFSVIIKQDVPAFEKKLANEAKLFKANGPALKFRNREIIPFDAKTPLDFTPQLNLFANGDFISMGIFIAALNELANQTLISHSLMITDLKVVEDPLRTWNPCTQTGNVDGPWTFKTLVKHLASNDPGHLATDAQISTFVKNWLNKWTANQTINDEQVERRFSRSTPGASISIATVLSNWQRKSTAAGAPAGQLDMRFAPFKLLAIVNRLDLKENEGYGDAKGGEGRFVFCLINNACDAAEEFTVIFEYGLPMRDCNLQAFALEWYNLKDKVLGSEDYNKSLVQITDRFSKCGTSIDRPNQSSINQIRTNEVALVNADINPQPWELREFKLNAESGQLDEVPVEKEPAVIYNAQINNDDVERLAKFINTHEAEVVQNKHTVTKKFERVPFLGGKAHVFLPPAGRLSIKPHHWDASTDTTKKYRITSDEARHVFSLNTCSGCHGGETQTFFTHIDPVFFENEATLSGFLTGIKGRGFVIPVNQPDGTQKRIRCIPFDADASNANGKMTVEDPAGRPSADSPRLYEYNDLKERARLLNNFATVNCFSVEALRNIAMVEPRRFTH